MARRTVPADRLKPGLEIVLADGRPGKVVGVLKTMLVAHVHGLSTVIDEVKVTIEDRGRREEAVYKHATPVRLWVDQS